MDVLLRKGVRKELFFKERREILSNEKNKGAKIISKCKKYT